MSGPEGERTGSGTMPIRYRPAPDMDYEQRKRRLADAYRWLLDGLDVPAGPREDEDEK